MDLYIEEHGRRLYGLCMHLCRNREEADDLYQETWLKVFAAFDRYDETKPFEPWVSRICMNTYRDVCRRQKANPFFNLFRSSEEKVAVMESQVESIRSHDDLEEAVQALEEKLRVTVILFYYYGLDIKETAETLHIPEGTVKSRLSTARKRLKEMLKDE